MSIAWDPNSEPDVAGYRVYYGTASRGYGSFIDVGNVTNYTVRGLSSGRVYFFAVTAYDSSNNQSGYSNEVSGIAPADLGSPGALAVTSSNSMTFSGEQGGPFSPVSQTYTLQNTGGTSINWAVSKGEGWISISPANGSLAARASVVVNVSVNSLANALVTGYYTDRIVFSNTTNGIGNTSRSATLFAGLTPQKIGIFRSGFWYFDAGNNGIWEGCNRDNCFAPFGGLAGDIPVVGDWTGDGTAKIGIYRKGAWFLDANANGAWDGCGIDICMAAFGGYPEDIPVVGDWTGTGTAKIGIYRKGAWFLDANANGAWDGCGVDTCLPAFGGLAQDLPVVGDWTGTGTAKIGIYRDGTWYLDANGNGTWDGCGVDTCVPAFGGLAQDLPVVGDWTGTGTAKIGIYRDGTWYLDANGNGTWDGCGVDTCVPAFGGLAQDLPVVGDWTGTGTPKIGIYRRDPAINLAAWYLDANGNGRWDGCEVDRCLGAFGGYREDIPIIW